MIQLTTFRVLHVRFSLNAQSGSDAQPSLDASSGLDAQLGLDARLDSDLPLKLYVLIYLFAAYQDVKLSPQAISYKLVHIYTI